jgi:transposase InsO family protein
MHDDPSVYVGATAQYASGAYQRVPVQHEIVCSMSRRGDCWDNAVAESFSPRRGTLASFAGTNKAEG